MNLIEEDENKYQQIEIFNAIQYTYFMIVKQALRIINCFGRLSKPKISKAENIHELMRNRSSQLDFINATNELRLNTNKFTSLNQLLSRQLNISQKKSSQIATTVIHGTAYSPVSTTPYRFSQKIGEGIVLQDATDVQFPYHPAKNNLKFHYSINQDVPNLSEYEFDKSTGYIFNLPGGIDERTIISQFGYQQVKSLKIHYCMLGLPAYAVVKFNSDRYLSERLLKKQLTIKLGEEQLRIFIEKDQDRQKLNRRQLVLKNVPKDETPASMLRKLSQFGRVINLDVPMEVYKQPTVKQIKQVYRNQRNPIQINVHRANGTIQSEYYPPFSSNDKYDASQRREQQYKRRLQYCENVDIEQEKQGQISTKAKGFCIVTFSCQEQAQNCYFQLRESVKMELLNGRQHFEFDEHHRQALLRFIDNSYIQKCLDENPTKEWDEQQKKKSSIFFQSLYMSSVYEKFNYSIYHELGFILSHQRKQVIRDEINYRIFLEELKISIGQGNLDPNSTTNKYGKSFDELAEEELYGMKLKEQSKNPRYTVNIDDYIRSQPKIIPKQKTKIKQVQKPQVQQTLEQMQQQEQQERKLMEELADYHKLIPKKFDLFKRSEAQQLAKIHSAQSSSEGKSSFSTMKSTENINRKKTLSEKIKSHMLYNKFVRNTINQYMGIFPTEKLQAQFYRKKPTYVNPQNLKFIDGSEFITEDEVSTVLQYSSSSPQNFYDSFVQQNEIVKSLNIDVEEAVMRNFQDNDSELLFEMSDIGVVKEEFEYAGNDFEGMVKKLNMEAEFGEEYQLVETSDNKKKIVKIAKLEHLMPVDLKERLVKNAKQFQKSPEFDPKKQQILQKYYEFLWNGKPVPDQLALAFGFEKGKPINVEKLTQQLCQQNNITKKELQKVVNIRNYTEQQINTDYAIQLKILKAREKRAAKKASDFGKDPSKILVKDQNNKSVVSKFRQI